MLPQPLHAAQFALDDAYRITGVSEDFAAFMDIAAEELLGQRAIDLIVARDRPGIMQLAAELGRGESSSVMGTCSFLIGGGASHRVTLVMMTRTDAQGGVQCTVIHQEAPRGRHAADESALEHRRAWVSKREEFAGRREVLMAQRESLLAERESFVDGWQRALDQRESAGRHAADWHIADTPVPLTGGLPADAPEPPSAVDVMASAHDASADASATRATDMDDPGNAARTEGAPATNGAPASMARSAGVPDRVAASATPVLFTSDLSPAAPEAPASYPGHPSADRDGHPRTPRHLTGRPATRHPRGPGRVRRLSHRPTTVQRDSLTGLDTRATLLVELAELGYDTANYAVLLIDLDDFKSVNDTYGHEVGDEVLTYVAESLRSSVRPDDLIVRYGGDEFVVLCADRAAAPVVAERIVSQFAVPLQTSAGFVTITASVGIGDGTVPTEQAEDLLGRADAAMYWAKHLGKNRYFVYDAELHAKVVADRHVEGLLRDAASDGRLVLRYQPIVDISGAIIGMEVVTRLLDHDGSMLMPDDFIPVAERVGAIGAIDTWVLGEACRTSAQIQQTVSLPLIVSVNVSVPLLAHDEFVDRVVAALDEAGLDASSLMLELSESALLHADAEEIEKLAALRDRGVHIAVDGFGLGYSPLAFLRRLPLTHVKMSRPCVMAVLDDERDAAMIEALTWLVDQLGLNWVAEGIETEAQWQAIQQYGPGYGQGFLFAQPLSEPQLIRALSADGIGRGTARPQSSVSS